MSRDPKTRFSDRVEAYLRFRPSYPEEILDLLESECGLDASRSVADIGSGTGILTRLFLERGHGVFAVEPNQAMRRAAELQLAGFDAFVSVDGTAEKTSLAPDSVHLIAAAQAFHWFDLEKANREFRRILLPEGWVAILWNDRRKSTTPFLRAYEDLLVRHGTDYELVDHTRVDQQQLASFFGPGGFAVASFKNLQILDRAALRGRIESCSYVPHLGEPGYRSMLDNIEALFDTHNTHGTVCLEYDTLVYYGRLS